MSAAGEDGVDEGTGVDLLREAGDEEQDRAGGLEVGTSQQVVDQGRLIGAAAFGVESSDGRSSGLTEGALGRDDGHRGGDGKRGRPANLRGGCGGPLGRKTPPQCRPGCF